MSASDSEEEARQQIARMKNTYSRSRTSTLEAARCIPTLRKEFHKDEIEFLDTFGLDPFEFEELHSMLEGNILRSHSSFRGQFGSRERLAICLKFLTSGASIHDLSRHYTIPYSMVPIILREVCYIITRHLMPIVMPRPTREMWEKNARDFKRKFDMPNCIGTLEGKNLSVNGRKTALLVLVDAHDRFMMVDVGHYHIRSQRGNVMDRSRMGRSLQRNEFNTPPNKPLTENSEPLPHMILASSLFPPKPYLMTKYSRPECAANDTNRVFNTRLSRAKITANRALMRLRNRFQVFKGPMTIPNGVIENLVLACCCLHNYFALRIRQTPEDATAPVAITEDRLSSMQNSLPNDSLDIRDKFKQYFLSPEGQVPWQWKDIPT